MDSFLRDIRYVTRALLRTPGFFGVTVLTLGLGVGATTAIFSVINGVLLRPLPYPGADRIVQVWEVSASGHQMNAADPNFDDWRTQSRSFAALAEFTGGSVVSVSGGSEPARVRAASVSADFFPALGVHPSRGRLFAPDEQTFGGPGTVVVSDAFWRSYLGANPSAVGSATLTMEGATYAVVGVMPAQLDFPAGVDLWTPAELSPHYPSRTAHNWRVLGRLRDGVSLETTRREMTAISRRLKAQYGDFVDLTDAAVVPLREEMTGDVRPALLVLFGAATLLLAIACANVVNLLMARLSARRGEVALRLALGAGRGRLARQFLAESLVLSLLGGLLGVFLAWEGVNALLVLDPGKLPRVGEVRVDLPVLGFALGISVLAAVALGLLTAWRGTRGELREALAESQRTQSGVGSGVRIRSTLVVSQIALTLVLLVGAGLLGRSFLHLVDVNPGFRTTRATVLDVALPYPGNVGARRELVRFYDDLLSQIGQLPGVTGVGGVSAFPLTESSAGNGTFLIMRSVDEPLDPSNMEALMHDSTRTGYAEFRVASAGYFPAMGIPLLRGRLFEDRDAPDAPHVALISESLAKTRWSGVDPLGKVIQFGNMDGDVTPFTIVGVVGDVHEASLAADPRPTFYAFYRQRPNAVSSINVVIRSTAPATVIGPVQRIVRTLRPDVPPRFRTIETIVASSLADRRFLLVLVGVFGGAALVLATLGVYSVIAFLVTQRTREIGVRVALGARTGDVVRMVLGEGGLLAGIGVLVGAAIGFALTGLLTRFLFGVAATDPLSFVGVALLLMGVALVASYVPARRAARVEPMRVLRES
jgi:putative ABC transport system permease protein